MPSLGAGGGGAAAAESDTYCRQVCERLNEQRKEGGAFCDVLLKVGGQTLPGHACVLSACSPFFRGLICGQRTTPSYLTALPQEIELHMPGIQQHQPSSDTTTSSDTAGPPATTTEGLETVLDVIDYIYTGRIELREDSVHLLVQMAEALALDELSALLQNYVDGGGVDCQKTAKVGRTKPMEKRKSLGPNRCSTKRVAACRSANSHKRNTSRLSPDVSATTITDEQNRNSQNSTTPSIVEVISAPPEQPSHRNLRSRKRMTRASEAIDPESDNSVPGSNSDGSRKRSSYKCGECDFVSASGPDILDHRQSHAHSKSFVCRTCGHFTVYGARMLTHLLTAGHTDTTCSLCGLRFPDHPTFIQHLSRHDHPKPFFCPLCEKRFRVQCHLNRHLTLHSTDRPFVCDICGRGFKNKHFMLIHVSNHSAVKSFSCSQCDYKTSFKTNLNMHLRGHQEGKIACPREGCKFQSISKYNLQSHLLTHAKQKPFQCEVCGQKFAQERSRRQHAKYHNDAMILRCGQCQFTTVRADRLGEHMYKVHEVGPPPPSKRHKSSANQRSTLVDPVSNLSDVETVPASNVREGYRPVNGGLDIYTPRMWFP